MTTLAEVLARHPEPGPHQKFHLLRVARKAGLGDQNLRERSCAEIATEVVVAALRDAECLLEVHGLDEIQRYVSERRIDAAQECLTTNALLQESCMNQRHADALYGLCEIVEALR